LVSLRAQPKISKETGIWSPENAADPADGGFLHPSL
jgi:hypothetical protein